MKKVWAVYGAKYGIITKQYGSSSSYGHGMSDCWTRVAEYDTRAKAAAYVYLATVGGDGRFSVFCVQEEDAK